MNSSNDLLLFMRTIEERVRKRYGDAGVGLVRAVLAERHPVEQAARQAGAVSDGEIRSWAWLFRKSLDVIAQVASLATSTRAAPRPVIEPEDPALDRDRMADAGDLEDLRLRSARGHLHRCCSSSSITSWFASCGPKRHGVG